MFISDDLAPLALLFAADTSCRKEISEDWCSPVYGKKELSPTFRVTTFAPLPVEFTTMLIPDSEVAAHLGFLHATEAEHRGVAVRALKYSKANAEDHLFFAQKPGNWHLGECASNARFLYCSTDLHKTVSQFVICEGSFFAYNGRRLFDTNLAVKHSEWSRDPSESSVAQAFDANRASEPAPAMKKEAEAPSEVSQYLKAFVSPSQHVQ